MYKQNNYLARIFFKIIAYILVAVASVFAYSQVAKYNLDIFMRVGDYEILTRLAFVAFIFILIIFIIFWFGHIINYIIDGVAQLKNKYRGNKISISISNLIEASILIAVGGKKPAQEKIGNINIEYLNNEQRDYYEIINIIASSDTPPITLYTYFEKYPFIRAYIAKKLANIELKLGNYEKALEYAREYYAVISDDEIKTILAKIYNITSDFKSMEAVLSAINLQESPDLKIPTSELYMSAAKTEMNSANNQDAMHFAKMAIEANPKNIEAAELFCEIAASHKKYDFINSVLLAAFEKDPSFEIAVILKKFTDMNQTELYQLLNDRSNAANNLGLMLAISAAYGLEEERNILLSKIG